MTDFKVKSKARFQYKNQAVKSFQGVYRLTVIVGASCKIGVYVILNVVKDLSQIEKTRFFATLRMVRQAKLWRFLIDERFYPW